jgi:hypothetical protein
MFGTTLVIHLPSKQFSAKPVIGKPPDSASQASLVSSSARLHGKNPPPVQPFFARLFRRAKCNMYYNPTMTQTQRQPRGRWLVIGLLTLAILMAIFAAEFIKHNPLPESTMPTTE